MIFPSVSGFGWDWVVMQVPSAPPSVAELLGVLVDLHTLSIVPQNQETMPASGTSWNRAEVLSRCEVLFSCSQRTFIQRSSKFCLFYQL